MLVRLPPPWRGRVGERGAPRGEIVVGNIVVTAHFPLTEKKFESASYGYPSP